MSGPSRVLLIDNIDSFTFNVADLLHTVVGVAPTVWRHDHIVDADEPWWLAFDAIVIGPGPGHPAVVRDMRLSLAALSQHDVPLLGVCLGHQGVAHGAGHRVAPMSQPRHGIVSSVHHDGTGLFSGIPSPFEVVRYHSLAVEPDPCQTRGPIATAWAGDDGAIMALAHPQARRWGVQFHPESVLSEHGERLVANFFAQAGVPLTGGFAPGAVAVGEVLQGAHAPTESSTSVHLVARTVPGRVDPWDLHEALAGLRATSQRTPGCQDEESIWLDSSDGQGASVFADASGPLAFTLEHRVGRGSRLSTGEFFTGPLFDTLDVLLARFALTETADPTVAGFVAPEQLPFDYRPGFAGYVGYEVKAETGGSAGHEAPRPDAWLIFADRAVVIDHRSGNVVVMALHTDAVRAEQERWLAEVAAIVEAMAQEGCSPADDLLSERSAPSTLSEQDEAVAAAGRHSQAAYEALVRRAQELIRAGETYEVCLTNQIRWPHPVNEAPTYRRLRQISPVPHGAWLRCGDFSVLSASPERFVAVSADGQVRAEPIKGTRARLTDPLHDQAAALELAADAKERAENLMIVDLLRNDLHRVCRAGSVEVPEMFAVRTWSTVHQLVSTITGRLAPGMRATDVLRSCFPGGSMTGAPKIRTTHILEDLEGGSRGVYSGAIGWIGLNGAMDTSIVIRSVVLDGIPGESYCAATFGVGGAITALSDPAVEYAETLIKARGVAAALDMSVAPSAQD